MNLLKALAAVSSMTLVSRILGFVRDAVVARIFGAGFASDAFFIAFKLPNMLRRIFAEGAFSQAFVPLLGEYRHTRSHDELRQFVARLAGAFGALLLLMTVLGMLGAPLMVWLSAPGFYRDAGKAQLTVQLLQITFPYIFFISLASLTGSLLNSWGMFSIPALTPVFLNVSFLVFALLLAHYFHPPVMALAWAVFCGGLIQLLWQLPYLYKIRMLCMPRLVWRDEQVWRVLRRMGPAIFGVSISQISLLINSTFASLLPQGSVSWMYYADRLMEFPTGILGVALGTILLPSLTRHALNKAEAEFSQLLDWGIKLTLLLAIPAAVGLAMLSRPLLYTLFMYGRFDAVDVQMTQQALIAYAIGLVGLIMVKVLAPGFYAQQNIKTPVRIALLTFVLTQLMSVVLMWPLKHAGLALSVGLGSCLNALLLVYALIRQRVYFPGAGWGIFLIRVTVAVGAMAAMISLLESYLPINWLASMTVRAIWLLVLVGAGVMTYFCCLWVMGMRPRDVVKNEALIADKA